MGPSRNAGAAGALAPTSRARPMLAGRAGLLAVRLAGVGSAHDRPPTATPVQPAPLAPPRGFPRARELAAAGRSGLLAVRLAGVTSA